MNDNNLDIGPLLRLDSVANTLPLPRPPPVRVTASEVPEITAAAATDVHLVPTKPPFGSLEAAPRASFCDDSAQERWDGFWSSADDRYYARCTNLDGSIEWYRYADERAAPRVRVNAARVLALRPFGWSSGRSVLLVGSRGGRPMLVGTSRRRPRSRARSAR
jgi:hypothetical protein